jgi:hypothetical protein
MSEKCFRKVLENVMCVIFLVYLIWDAVNFFKTFVAFYFELKNYSMDIVSMILVSVFLDMIGLLHEKEFVLSGVQYHN